MAASAKGRKYLAWQLRVSARLERHFRARMRKEILARYRAAAAGYARDRIIGAENAMRGHLDAVGEIVREQYARSVQVFGAAVLDSLKGRGAYRRKDYQEDYYDQLVREWIESTETINRIHGIAQTTKAHIRNLITQGLGDGLGTDAIARLIRKRYGNLFAGLRAHVVARTETHNAAAFANDAAARASGVGELRREWVAAEDDRTRDEHMEASGQVVGMDDPFVFDGYVLMRPGDPEGPAKGTIMCRCGVVYHTPA